MYSYPGYSCSNTFNSNERENIASTEEGQISSFMDDFELERWVDETAKLLGLCGNDDFGNISLESADYIFKESDQETSLVSENNSTSTNVKTSPEHSAYNTAPDSRYFPLHHGSSAYLAGVPDNKDSEKTNYWGIRTSKPVYEWERSVAYDSAANRHHFPLQQEAPSSFNASAYRAGISNGKDNETCNYWASNTSQPVQEWGRSFVEPIIEKLNTRDFWGAFPCPVNVPTENQNFNYFSLAPQSLSEEYIAEIHASNRIAFHAYDKGMSDSIKPNEGNILYNTNVMTIGNDENYDFRFRQGVEDQQTFSSSYKAQNQISSEVPFHAYGAGWTEPQNRSKILISSTNAESILRSSGGHPCPQKLGTFNGKECGKSFKAKHYLKGHYRIHRGERPFTCNVCGQGFSRKFNLTTHIRSHTKEKPFTCDECGRSFSLKGNLKTHIRIHTKDKPFACKECGRRFSDKTTLKNHIRIHTKEKPFDCDECGRSFSKKFNLTTHIRIHTGEKPFACIECRRSFSNQTSLTFHIRTHRGERLFTCDV